jgi:hypothetical protein
MNPGKMRDTYGKMMFILQDTQTHIVKSETNNLSFLKEILTVVTFLRDRQSLALLNDPLVEEATHSIDNSSGDKTREDLLQLSQRKQEAVEELVQKYESGTFL